MKTYPIHLTFDEHKAILHLLHGTILDIQDMPSDELDPRLLPVFKAVYCKYSSNFVNSGMFEDLVSSIH